MPDITPVEAGEIDVVVRRAVAAGESLWKPATALLVVAEALGLCGDEIIAVASEESGFAAPLMQGELARTLLQLRQFAEAAAVRVEWDELFSPADADDAVPSLWRTALPLGVVVVFTASNFPLAFGAAGTDAAAALAAGCAVVVKPHPLHPRTDALVVEIAREALESAGWPADRLLLAPGSSMAVGGALVRHPSVSAVSFTGSYSGGRALMDLAAARPRPIPVYAEMSSANPVLLSRAALVEGFDSVVTGAAASLTARQGQLCTKPGLFFVADAAFADAFADGLSAAVSSATAQALLSPAMSAAHMEATDKARQLGARVLPNSEPDAVPDGIAAPTVALLSRGAFEADKFWQSEHFGPFAVVVACDNEDDALRAIAQLPGSLVATMHVGSEEKELAVRAARAMARGSGRVVRGGWPTGVPVARGTVHAGPFPSANTSISAVGPSAIRRYLRSVTYQGFEASVAEEVG